MPLDPDLFKPTPPPLKSPVVPTPRLRQGGAKGGSRRDLSRSSETPPATTVLEYLAIGLRWTGAWVLADRPSFPMDPAVHAFWEDRYAIGRLIALLRKKQSEWTRPEARMFLRTLTAYWLYWHNAEWPEEEVSWRELREVPPEWEDDPAPYLMDWWIQGYRYTDHADAWIRYPMPEWNPLWPSLPAVTSAWLPNTPWPLSAWRTMGDRPVVHYAQPGEAPMTNTLIRELSIPGLQWRVVAQCAADQTEALPTEADALAILRQSRQGSHRDEWFRDRLIWMTWCMDAYADRLVV